MNSEKTTLDFKYNADGIRTKKIVTTTSDHVHAFQDAVVQPTCTENGYTLHSCICGYIYQDAPTAATGHTFTTTVVGTNCTEVGHKVYSCSCGYYYEDGSNGHDFTTLVVEPSETVNGFTLHECECGYSYESDPVASLAGTGGNTETVSDVKEYDYIYNGSSLTQLTITTTIHGDGTTIETLYFAYDGSSPMTVTYGGEVFYYVTNLQGDVIAILDDEGAAVVEYSYDAWGNILEIGGSEKDTLGVANPLTYRGYVYDRETSLYYLQSRYYNPEVGRFINADAMVSTGQGFVGNNMFAYCRNNPVCNADQTGLASANVLFPVCLGGNGPNYTIVSSSDEEIRSKELLAKILSTTNQNYISPQYGRMLSISVKHAGKYISKSSTAESIVLWLAGTALIFASPPFSLYAGLTVQGISLVNLYIEECNLLPNQEYDMYSVTTVWESAEYYNGKIVYVQHVFEWEMIFNDTQKDNPIWFCCGQNYTSRY